MFRTLVKSGNTSYIISLPISWIRNHNLAAGDSIHLAFGSNDNLILAPQELQITPKLEEFSINIDGKDTYDLRNEIISAYIDDYKNIRLIGKEIKDKSLAIKEIAQQLIALDILEQTPQHLILRNFFDYEDTSIKVLTKKQDLIIKTIFSEIKPFFEHGLDIKDYEEINRLNEQMNKLNLLGLKITKKSLIDQNLAKKFGTNNLEILLNSKVSFFLENISHHLKTIAKDLIYLNEKKNLIKDLKEIYLATETTYLQMMDAYHQKNKAEMSSLTKKERAIAEKIQDLHRINEDLIIGRVLENMSIIQEYLIRITKLGISF